MYITKRKSMTIRRSMLAGNGMILHATPKKLKKLVKKRTK